MRPTRWSAILAASAALLTAATPAAAQEDSLDEEIRALRSMLEGVQQDGERLRDEVDVLWDEQRDDWLSRQRATEIRGVVTDLLTDAQTRTSLRSNGLMAGWDGRFFLRDPDNRFLLELDGQIQTRFLFNAKQSPDRYRWGFEVPRAALTMSGHMFGPDIEYHIRTDVTRNDPSLVPGLIFLRDAWVRYRFDDTWSVRFGQFKLPFNREELVDSRYQMAVERSLVNETTNIDRSQGIELEMRTETDRVRLTTSDGSGDNLGGTSPFGLVDSTARVNSPALSQAAEWAIAGRWDVLLAGEWEQFEDFTSPIGDPFGVMLGVAAHGMQTENDGFPSASRNEVPYYGATADVSIEFGGASLFASAIFHYVETTNFGRAEIFGAVVQGAFYIAPRHELFARFEYGSYEFRNIQTADISDLNLGTVGWNYYVDGHDAKFTLDFGLAVSIVDTAFDSNIAGWQVDPAGDEYQWVIRSQFQLLF